MNAPEKIWLSEHEIEAVDFRQHLEPAKVDRIEYTRSDIAEQRERELTEALENFIKGADNPPSIPFSEAVEIARQALKPNPQHRRPNQLHAANYAGKETDDAKD